MGRPGMSGSTPPPPSTRKRVIDDAGIIENREMAASTAGNAVSSEERPTCRDCSRLHVECQYLFQIRSYHGGGETTKTQRGERVDATILIPPTLRMLAWKDMIELDFDMINFRPLILSHALQNMDHFVRCDRSWLKNPTIQHIMQHDAVSQATGHSYLLHAVLAVSAAHQAIIRPESRSYNTVSLVHWQMFLRGYSRCLQGDFASKDADAVFFASHLHSMLASVHERNRGSEEEWLLPGWFQSMKGVTALWNTPDVIAQLGSGVWKPWTQSHEPSHQRAIDESSAADPESTSPVLVALRDYCESLSDEDRCAHGERIDFLLVVENNLSGPQGLNCLSWYITTAPADYLARLRSRDEMSLLLLLYWCQLASRAGQWWLAQAANFESEKICAYLSQAHSNEMVLTLLDIILGAEGG